VSGGSRRRSGYEGGRTPEEGGEEAMVEISGASPRGGSGRLEKVRIAGRRMSDGGDLRMGGRRRGERERAGSGNSFGSC